MYPSHEEGVDILERFNNQNPLVKLEPVATKDDIIMCQEEVNKVYVHRDLMDYIVRICEATRNYDNVALGVSPRGALSLLRVAKGFAAISDRDFLTPDDIKKAAMPVLPHRLVMNSSSRIKKNAAIEVIEDVLSRVPVPTEAMLGWSAGK